MSPASGVVACQGVIDPGWTVTVPWHLALGALDELSLSIDLEPGDRLALHFASSNEWADLPYLQIAMVQPGRQSELHPLHAPARSLMLPRPMAPLDDLWLLVRTATRRYWFEVPYGVCGSPEQRRALESPVVPQQAGPPQPPPGAMVDDALIPWRAIRFSLGRVDGYQLDVTAASTRPGELELAARREAVGLPPELTLTTSSGSVQLLEPWCAPRVELEQLHVARYAFVAEGRPTRSYLRLRMQGSSTFDLTLPSSLTDPAHCSAARRLPSRLP